MLEKKAKSLGTGCESDTIKPRQQQASPQEREKVKVLSCCRRFHQKPRQAVPAQVKLSSIGVCK